MISKSVCIQNIHCYVALSMPQLAVVIGEFRRPNRQVTFIQSPELEERYKEFEENFNEEITFETAVYFFNPAAGKVITPTA